MMCTVFGLQKSIALLLSVPSAPWGCGAQNSFQEGQFVPSLLDVVCGGCCDVRERGPGGASAGPQATPTSASTGQDAPGRHTLDPQVPGCPSIRSNA